MNYEGYKHKFRINISHDNGTNSKVHYHTIEITMYIRNTVESFEGYDKIESIIKKYLDKYSGKYLNEMEIFAENLPTIENIGEVFYKELKELLVKDSYELVKLEITETPTRVYVVTEFNKGNIFGYSTKFQKLSYLINEAKAQGSYEVNNQLLANEKVIEQKESQVLESDGNKSVENNKKKLSFKCYIIPIILIMLASLSVAYYVWNSKFFPTGYDIYGHLFKGNFLYNSLKEGDIYPLFTRFWYNGVQPFRYWAPLSYYFLAILQFIVGGNIFNAYIAFIAMNFFLGALGWLRFGRQYNRMVLCTSIAMLWFFMPDNLRVFFSEGNIPRIFITMLLPHLFYNICRFNEERNKKYMIHITVITCLIILSHLMIGAMVTLAVFLVLLIYAITNKRYKEFIYTTTIMFISFAIVGIWLLPNLKGGLVGMEKSASGDVMSKLFEVSISLNPFLKIEDVGSFYFGISIFLIMLLGIFLSGKKSAPAFLAAMIIFIGTTTTFSDIIYGLGLNQYIWMMRFTPIAYTIVLIGIIKWDKCKKIIPAIFIVVMFVDGVSNFSIERCYNSMETNVGVSNYNEVAESIGFAHAADITQQRVAIYDRSLYGSFPSLYFSLDNRNIPYTYGWGWQGTATSSNIVLLNTALEKQYYYYLFDRSIEMGADTLILKKSELKYDEDIYKKVESIANIFGYKMEEENKYSFVYHKDIKGNFGIKTDYEALAIGNSANYISLEYPIFERGHSNNIEDYTYEELSKYKKIYLSGFKYKNKSEAEKLIRRLTNDGIKVFIDMNSIPNDILSGKQIFLNVEAESITFNEKFPKLKYKDKEILCDDFSRENSTWKTVYLNNLENTIGSANHEDREYDFLGTGENENMVFIGFNLLYHTMEDNDENTRQMLNDVFGTDAEKVPKREIVDIDVKYEANQITINTNEDKVNTTIAYQDNFISDSKVEKSNNLLTVNRGTTKISIQYPYLKSGILLSILGLILIIMVINFYDKRTRGKQK
ncbi:MAG: 6-pyruvoyl-tetrahydropterin synthase-related protein [Clostridiaceae bacterium]|nr:6-pyruvoyl-tetrahydropterin synthase-related protein [Clostridiaceae bacterium]